MESLELIGRQKQLFVDDLRSVESELGRIVSTSGFLVIGGAGSIGQAVSTEIFKRNPRVLHVVDISENNLVELVRSLRSSVGYCAGDFQTFAIDCGSPEFDAMLDQNAHHYDYVLNLSALKHVRSESDPFTLMRMIKTNIFNTVHTLRKAEEYDISKYFCVSTDKAANPVNMMGASKRIMELFVMRESRGIPVSMARFANVAFSDGSLLHGFNARFAKRQPLSAPSDVRRYFVTPQESGELCLLAAVFGENLDVFFPKLSEVLHLTRFSDIARLFLNSHGYEVLECATENEAREKAADYIIEKKWPCHFFKSDTTGEKDFEEFFTENEVLDWARFKTIGVIKNEATYDSESLNRFEAGVADLMSRGRWSKIDLLELFYTVLPEFDHLETGKYLDQRM